MNCRKGSIALLSVFLSMSGTTRAQNTGWVSLATGLLGLDTVQANNMYVADLNGDRYPDFLTLKGNWSIGSEDALRAYISVRDMQSSDPSARKYVEVTSASGVNSVPDPLHVSRGTIVAALADVNNDGHVDMVRGNYYHRLESFTDQGDRCEVLLGDGTGSFRLVKDGFQGLGLINATGFSFLDYDRDGYIDLFIATWFKDYKNDVWDHGYLMKGNGDGTFTNVSASAGITEPEPMYGCSVVDWNNDGWPDIATGPYCRTRGQLWQNNGNGRFTNVAVAAGYNARYMQGDGGQNLCLWSPVPEDFDNDGDMDFFFSLVHGGADAQEGRSTMVLNGGASNNYRLTPDRSLMTRKSPQSSHLGDYDGSWFDLDNDGLMDLAMAQGYYGPGTDRLYVFHQSADNKFMDITGSLGLVRAEARDLHMVEVLDYDRDGDDDILICKDGQPRDLNMIENRIGQDNNWTGINLHAPAGVNGSCIGARIYVWSGGVQRMREVYAGRGNNGGQQPFGMLFGLGKNSVIDSLSVHWPDVAGSRTTVYNPPVNRYLELTLSGLNVPDGDVEKKMLALKVYPNPARDFILYQLSGNTLIARMELFDVMGRIQHSVMSPSGDEPTGYCSLRDLVSGQYFLRVITADGRTVCQPFVKGE